MPLQPGLRAETHVVVGPDDTAEHVGSGDVPVLGTPRLLALAEAATVEAVASRLEPGQTTVGTRVELDHRVASPVGARVTIEAELTEVDGRRLVFAVRAAGESGAPVADGRIERVVVDRQRFLARVTNG
ncbi:hotdog domain-containing protein [Spirillospora sp. NPDC047279]|uniref:thioesterase family protein n=1 Tax=Spirillospora sp. NPDC047279 TaxID=3155478 RepID=UPI00340780C4